MDDKVLICTVGLPRSGKSTWAREQDVPIVSRDSIRLSLHGHQFIELAEPIVKAIAKVMVRSLFLAGHHIVIVDEDNTTDERRMFWVEKEWLTYWKVFTTPAAECRRRAGDDQALIKTIDRMHQAWESIDDDGGMGNILKPYQIEGIT